MGGTAPMRTRMILHAAPDTVAAGPLPYRHIPAMPHLDITAR